GRLSRRRLPPRAEPGGLGHQRGSRRRARMRPVSDGRHGLALVHWRKSSRRFSRDPTIFAAGRGAALARWFIGENRRDDFRETLQFSPRTGERPWPAGLSAKIVETIFARPYNFRRGPGSGPGPLVYRRKSSRRFSRDPTIFAAGQGAALARWFIGENRRDDFRETLQFSPRARERPWPAGLSAKIVETIFARPYNFRRGPGSGPGPLCRRRKSSRRFSR